MKHCFGMTELVNSKDPTTQLAMEADLEAIMCLLDKWDIHLRMRYIESARNPADYHEVRTEGRLAARTGGGEEVGEALDIVHGRPVRGRGQRAAATVQLRLPGEGNGAY